MMSAAEPWIGALIAARSLNARSDGIGRGDARVMAPAPEDRRDVALLAADLLRRVHVVADAGEALEILLDVGARLLARDAELVGEAEGRDAVDDAEVDRLGAAAHFGGHVLHRHAEHFRRGHRVNVEPVREGLLQLRDVGDMREDAQLDLRVIRRDQRVPRRRHERRADLAPGLRADRNVLQVRLGRRQPPRRRRRQREARVHALRPLVDVAGQGVGVGRFQLLQLSAIRECAPAVRGPVRRVRRARSRSSTMRPSPSSCRPAGPSCRTGCRRAAWASRG